MIKISMDELWKMILSDANQLTLIVSVVGWFFIVVGWVIALALQRSNVKQQHRVQIKYDIYKQFVQLRKDIQHPLGKLGAAAHPPFVSMESSMIPFKLKLKKEFKEHWIPYDEQECLFEGEKKWSQFVNELYELYFDFTNHSLKMFGVFEDWEAALKPLLGIREQFFNEIQNLEKQIHGNLKSLRSFTDTHGHDWRKWDQQEVEKVTEDITEITHSIGTYYHDFMVLIHNELLSKYFWYKRPTRKTLDPNYKVLTKKGIVESVDWEKLNKAKAWKKQLIKYSQDKLQKFDSSNGSISPKYKKYLESIVEGLCPDCRIPILVMDANVTEGQVHFVYSCGHGHKEYSVNEEASIKELYKLKSLKEGVGKVREIIQGWKPSGDKKLRQGVDYYRDINREDNEYHQIVKDHQTKEVLHEEHEPLTEHRQK